MSDKPGRRYSEPKEGLWDYDGAYLPNHDGTTRFQGQTIFSVGCFRWEKKARGKGLKRGKSVVRFKGHVHDARWVYEQAEAFCARMEEHAKAVDPGLDMFLSSGQQDAAPLTDSDIRDAMQSLKESGFRRVRDGGDG